MKSKKNSWTLQKERRIKVTWRELLEKAAPNAVDHVARNRWNGEAAKQPNPSPFTPRWEARQVSQSVFNKGGNPSQRSRPLPQLRSHCDEAEPGADLSFPLQPLF